MEAPRSNAECVASAASALTTTSGGTGDVRRDSGSGFSRSTVIVTATTRLAKRQHGCQALSTFPRTRQPGRPSPVRSSKSLPRSAPEDRSPAPYIQTSTPAPGLLST